MAWTANELIVMLQEAVALAGHDIPVKSYLYDETEIEVSTETDQDGNVIQVVIEALVEDEDADE